MLCVPANAIGYATKSTNSYEHDILIGAIKWGLHFFSPINLNESHIHGTVKKEAVSFLTDNSPFAHASTILKMKNGSFICAWFSGAEEGAMDTRIWYSIKKPNGSWGKPVQLQDGINYSHWNPVLYLTKEGNVRLYYKSNGSCKDWIGYYCESRDCGITWCPAYRTGLLNNNSGIDLVKSDDGYLWLVCNPAFSVRSPLTLYVSKDDGNTWLSVMDIEKFLPIEFSYPSIIADGRTLYITYTNMRMGINCLTIRY